MTGDTAGYDVTLHAGWGEDCIRFRTSRSPMLQHSVEEAAELLSLSDDLAAELTDWDDEYQDVLNIDVPQDSEWPSPEARQAWLEKGKTLAARIKRESPVVSRVEYFGNGTIADGECVF
ncbi:MULTISPECIES: hypothetical protein [Actinoalloteichus]|uniref:Uncharacterized protein n=1 Tax=Actinoalloteichus fjordicus TaxID=1612552 RepID=A0AAC9L7B7_9PSEU|nr:MULTISPECIES: hypothetical protein [Actinoalloteichus]APU12693.1 hypothetical protein UA74_03050 [Actinoalloteichus fjordicus]APU18663.1 hypothetical protein UA75_03140 [Actinoalloteichus sp. GBA129-24]